MKKGYLILVIVITVVAIGSTVFIVLQQGTQSNKTNTANLSVANNNQQNNNTGSQINTNIKALKKSILIYARKNGTTVTVFQRDVKQQDEITLFNYKELKESGLTGNYWTDLWPSISISPDAKEFIYAADDGVYIRNRSDDTIITLVQKTGEGSGISDAPPTWSVDFQTSRPFGLYSPGWSADGAYVNMVAGYYEGSGNWIMGMNTNEFLTPVDQDGEKVGRQHDGFSWSPTGHRYVIAHRPGYAETGLFVSRANDMKVVDELLKLQDPYVYGGRFSSDGLNIVFTYKLNESQISAGDILATISVAGENKQIISQGKIVMAPIYSKNGDEIIFAVKDNNTYILRQYNLVSKATNDVLTLPSSYDTWRNPYWTDEGYLALEGTSRDLQEKQLFIFDPSTTKTIYQTGPQSWFTTFIGFVE